VDPEVPAEALAAPPKRRTAAIRASLKRWRERHATPFVGGNRVLLLKDGGPYFAELLAAIGGAKSYILLETYILAGDQTGWRIARALAAKAKEGVEVALACDGYGSMGLDPYFAEFLLDAGVRLFVFHPISILRRRWPWSKRDHRKLCVVDGRVGLVGGMNISDDYAALEDGGRGWRDWAVRIEGPAVEQLDRLFRRFWKRYRRRHPLRSAPLPAPTFPGGHVVRFVANFARRDRAEIRREYLRAIAAAERQVRLTAAYFTPDRGLLRALVRAARRGVRVELITAGATDVWLSRSIARGLYGPLLKAGVDIFEWNEVILHAKAAVIDSRWSTIGSANLNHRTYLMDYEVNATILGPEVATALEDQFDVDRRRSLAVTNEVWRARPLLERALSGFLGLFRRLF
jgi:cardiolipin synthase